MLGHGPGHATALKALKGAGVKTPSGGAAGIAKAAGLHGVPGADAGKGSMRCCRQRGGAGHAAPGAAAPAGGAAPVAAPADAASAGCSSRRCSCPRAAVRRRLHLMLRAVVPRRAYGCRERWYRTECFGRSRPGVPAAAGAAAGAAAAAGPPVSSSGGGGVRLGGGATQSAGAGGASPGPPPVDAAMRGPQQRPLPPKGLPQPPSRCPEVVRRPLLPLSCSPARTCRCRPRRERCSRRAALTRGCVSVLSNAVSHHTIVLGDAESVVDPVHAQAVDIVAVDGQPIGPANIAARDLITEIAALDPSVRPNEIGTPWPIESPGFFTDPAQAGRLHLAFVSSADFQPGAGGAGAPAAARRSGAGDARRGRRRPGGSPPPLRLRERPWRIGRGPPERALAGRARPWLIFRPPEDDRCRRGLAAGQARHLPTRGR